MQNRLTKKSIVKEIGYVVDNPTVERCVKVIDKLGEYEDAEENGLLVRLPCKVGDLLYEAGESEIYTYIVDEIHVEQDSKVIVYALEYDADLHRVYQNGYEYDNYEFGKTVFLTREEAGKALEEDKQRAETEEV